MTDVRTCPRRCGADVARRNHPDHARARWPRARRTVAVCERSRSVRGLLRAERIVLRAKKRRHGARGGTEATRRKLPPIGLAAIRRRV